MAVTLSQLRALDALHAHRSFSVAAESLGVSQPAVSGTIAALERTVGGPVIDRGAMRFTPLGEALIPHARRALAAIDGIALEAAVHAGGPAGTVRVGVTGSVRAGLLPKLEAHWKRVYPGIGLAVLEGDDLELPIWLEAGLVDLAVLIDAETRDPRSIELPGDPLCLAVPARHPFASRRVVRVAEIDPDELLCNSGGCEVQTRRLYREAGIPFVPNAYVQELGTLLAMVAAGKGVAVLSGYARAMLPDGVALVPVAPTAFRTLTLTGLAGTEWTAAGSLLVHAAQAWASCAGPGADAAAARAPSEA